MPNLDFGEIIIEPWVIVIIIIVVIAFLVIAVIWGIKAHKVKVSAGKEEMIGRSARVVTTLDPRGTVFLEGEQWTAISEEGTIEAGEEVTVTGIDGLKIYVKKQGGQ
ncbi:MAG: NfeD family protein [Dehalococcoidales bacterium]|nr:NfeD family protein [Dehalococcoidales bacterium]